MANVPPRTLASREPASRVRAAPGATGRAVLPGLEGAGLPHEVAATPSDLLDPFSDPRRLLAAFVMLEALGPPVAFREPGERR